MTHAQSFTTTDTFNFTGSIQTFIVPVGANTINLSATGAGGGLASGGSATYTPGRGVTMSGNFSVSAGDTLQILVGERGNDDIPGFGGGGGGGTYIANGPTIASATLMLAAGGGGGAGTTGTQTNSNASTGTSGIDGSGANPGTGGTAGAGGTFAAVTSGAGAGWLSNA
ncbi:hypothetical protein N8Z73_00640 [bacterium]|nr:hypothetical protein [bacterium]MDC1221389.1 hypothetical protein [Salibacteraceae bacterium]